MLAKGSAQAARDKRLEFLAWVMGDFRRFAGIVDIIAKNGARQKLRLNEIQQLYCANRTQRDVVLKARQMGFTTLEQVRDLFVFLTVPGSRVVVTCQSITDHGPARQLAQNFRVMFQSLERAGLGLKFHTASANEWVLADRDSTLRIVEAGASEAAAEKKGRAGTITRLHLTETAFYEYAEATLNAMLECVPGEDTGSEIVDESTPNGAAGFFFEQCQAAKAGRGAYKFHFYPWHVASEYSTLLEAGETFTPETEREKLLADRGCTAKQLKWYRAKVVDKGQDKTDQEYPSDPDTCFLLSGRSFFDQGRTARLLEQAREPVEKRDRDRIWVWKRPEPGRGYVIAADTSEGGGNDPSGALVYDWETAEHVATVFGQYSMFDYAAALDKLGREYNTALVAVERNNHGHAVLLALHRVHGYPCIYEHDDEKPGWPTTPVTRPVMLDELEEAHSKGYWTSPDRQTLGQLKTFIVPASGKPQAGPGAKDDLVLAAAVGWAVRARAPRPEETDQGQGGYERSSW